MRSSTLILATAIAVLVAGLWALQAAEPSKAPPLPSLKVDKSAPLLLDALPETKPEKPTGPVADNNSCYCCHRNYEEEEMVHQHAIANVGCIKCHGESVAHRNDEDNITPPDVIYPLEKIEENCKQCHDSHDVSAKKVLAKWQKKCPAKTDVESLVCTDCHGEHRLKIRTSRWDKHTRQYLPDLTKAGKAKDNGQKKAVKPEEEK